MSDTLRSTQAGYQRQLDQIDIQIGGHKKAIEDLEKKKSDVEAAKKVVDEAVAKLPPEPKQSAAAAPNNRPSS